MPTYTQVIQAYYLDKKKHQGYNQKILNNDGKTNFNNRLTVNQVTGQLRP
jgi:hypothetical protein